MCTYDVDLHSVSIKIVRESSFGSQGNFFFIFWWDTCNLILNETNVFKSNQIYLVYSFQMVENFVFSFD